ncbi:MAG TPA: bifunctional lysylphosphatidylglycerol flippase/synthetase MprF [Steroidobacteraceae bacterium]|jgi:phosphatidylglycerol lysyltransferase|nr:bifunctional lysylphosphatidylglycerol flippase/synthetase MprF [Steroidobacteraceae bacterium]
MTSEESNGTRLRWIGPLASLLVFAVVAFVLHRELAHLHTREILEELRQTPRAHVLIALAFTTTSYWLLGFYDLLGLRYLGKAVAYRRTLLTSFIANAFGHNLGLAAFTGGAVRFRLYASAGLTAVDVATLQGFCSLTIGIALATLGGLSLTLEPTHTAAVLHLHPRWAMLVGIMLLSSVAAYATWCIVGRIPLEIRGWALRPPRPALGFAQIALGVCDLSCSTAVLWWLLPPQTSMSFLTFVGAYAAAVTAGIVSHVPGGLGVFETVIVFALPDVPASSLLGSMLVYRAVYYLAPLTAATLLFGLEELRARRGPLARAHALASLYIAPVVPQVAGTLTFLAGFILLVSGATPSMDVRLTVLRQFLPLAVLELSHLAGSVIGLGLVVLSRALFRRVQAAYHISFWLLAAGIAASLLKGLDFEEATVLAVVLAVLVLGRRAFYRPTSILDEGFTPIWAVSIAGVIATAIWVSFLAFRHIELSNDLWWTFAMDANAPRTLRALFLVVVLATAYLLLSVLQPARPEPGVADEKDLDEARRIIRTSDLTIANAALSGDKRLLFSDDREAFVMYQVAGRSWIALGDPVGAAARAEELVWRFRELSDHHGGRTVFYQASADCLALYIDLGLAALKIGEEARVPLSDFSLEGAARADLRQAWRRAERDGATFEVIPPERIAEVLPDLRRISDSWLARKSVAEKRFSVGAFSEAYMSNFATVLVRSEGNISAFANLWRTGSKEELSIDLMRFGPDAPRGAMDYMFIELMLWGRAHGYRWFNLGMAPLAGLESHPLAPAWHRVGNFVFRHGEHFYNFDGLRRYKTKFDPTWVPKYLVAPGGIALPRILVDVSMLISGGMKELFGR